MVDIPEKEIKLFYCYAREDKQLRDELELHLSWLKRRYQLTNWHDREILPGENWEEAIDTHLNTAHLILLLISPNFMASDYCYSKEMQRALERHKAGTCRVVPILLRPTFWEDAPFSYLQLLPTDAKPITRWSDRDDAFQNIMIEINRTIKDLLISLKTKEEWLQEGDALHYNFQHYEEALAAYEQAIRIDPNYAHAYYKKGFVLDDLERPKEALTAYEQCIRLDPNYVHAYSDKGYILEKLKRHREALAAYKQAISLDPSRAITHRSKGNILHNLQRYEEALAAYEQAISLDPNYGAAYRDKGYTLEKLNRNQEAELAFEKALQFGYKRR